MLANRPASASETAQVATTRSAEGCTALLPRHHGLSLHSSAAVGEVPKCHRARRSTGDHDSEQDEQRNDTHQPEQSEGTHVRHVPRPDSWNQDGGGGEGRKRHEIERQEQRHQLQAIHQASLTHQRKSGLSGYPPTRGPGTPASHESSAAPARSRRTYLLAVTMAA